MYNWVEKDFYSGKFRISICEWLDFWTPINDGWNLELENYEVGQILGGN